MPKIIDHNLYLYINDILDSNLPERSVYRYIKEQKITTHESEEYGKLIEFKSLKWDWK